MQRYGPEFIDVTWGAGGTSADLTTEIVATAQSVYGLETMMHLTCTNMPVKQIDDALEVKIYNGIEIVHGRRLLIYHHFALQQAAKNCGCQNILALRGDPPKGQANWESCKEGFEHADDLVRYIREKYNDYFCIAVAGKV